MNRIKITFFLFSFSLLNSFIGFSQNRLVSENTEISLITCDSGTELYSLFGHTALRVKDVTYGIDDVYNYGYFDFRTPNFYLKFVKGDLQYFAAADRFDNFMAEYVYDQRGVYEQKLNLTLEQKQKIVDNLNDDLSSDKKFYTYKFIDKNCTTMVADIINENISDKLSLKINDAGKTDRTILYKYLKTHFYANLGICIMFGAKTDRKFDHAFLPLQLLESVSKTKNNGQPLTRETKTLNIQSAETQQSIWDNWYSYILVFLIIALVNKRIVSLTYLTFSAVLGIFLIWVGSYSLHKELLLNYNILLFNPVLLLLTAFVLKKNYKWALRLAYACLGLLLVYVIVMFNKVHFLLFIPMIATTTIILIRVVKQTRKSLLASVK